MRALLLALCLLLAGCGSLADSITGSATLQHGQVTGSITAETPFGNITFSDSGIRGELSFLVTIVDFTDQTNPISDTDAAELLQRLDAWVAKHTTGVAWVRGRVQRVTLGSTADYTGDTYTETSLATKLQNDARAASVGPEKFKLYLTPPNPILATGGGFTNGTGGEAFLAVWTVWQNLPIPHEVGHMLGFGHGPVGVMRDKASGASMADQADWNAPLQ